MRRIWISLLLIVVAPAVKAETYGQRVVAAVLLGEARGEGREGMLAVAEVIRNRSNILGISPLAVVKQDKQFSCLNGSSPEELVRRFQSSPHWETALSIARMTYNNPERLPGITNGATHFHSCRAYWAKGEHPVAVVGNLRFYRLPVPN